MSATPDPAADNAPRELPASPLDPSRAYHSPAAWLRFLIPAILGVAGDLWLKAWAFPTGVAPDGPGAHLAGRFPAPASSLTLIPNILELTTTVNHGAVFGTLKGWVFFFLAFSVVALALILWVFATSKRSHWLVHIALGLILAGALGNMYDRAVYHGVRDMLRFVCFRFSQTAADGSIKFTDWYPYIFNVADVMLCVGVPVLMLRWLFMGDSAHRHRAAQ
jgi:signal peptidase II